MLPSRLTDRVDWPVAITLFESPACGPVHLIRTQASKGRPPCTGPVESPLRADPFPVQPFDLQSTFGVSNDRRW